jgi:hypothetical protein
MNKGIGNRESGIVGARTSERPAEATCFFHFPFSILHSPFPAPNP